jgi:hypothetical protein
VKEPPETVILFQKSYWENCLRGAALLNRLDRGSGYRRERTGICAVKTDKDLIGRVLQACVGLMQLASRLARQLAKLVTIGHLRECPENQIRTHYEFLLKKQLLKRNNRAPSGQLATKKNPRSPILPFLWL